MGQILQFVLNNGGVKKKQTKFYNWCITLNSTPQPSPPPPVPGPAAMAPSRDVPVSATATQEPSAQ